MKTRKSRRLFRQRITNSIMTTGNPSVGEILIIEGIISVNPADANYIVESDIITPTGMRSLETTLSTTKSGARLIFMPDEPGEWLVNTRLVVDGLEDHIQIYSIYRFDPKEGDNNFNRLCYRNGNLSTTNNIWENPFIS